MIYLLVFFILLYLSFYYDINRNEMHKEFWTFLIFFVLVIIAGLRFRVGADTTNYLYRFYHEYPTINNFSFQDYGIGEDPGFALLNSIVKTLGGRFYVVQLIHSAFVNYVIFKYIKKYCSYFFTALLFYYIYIYFSYNMEIMRASMSIAICLYANDFILNKKWFRGYFLLLLALTFHVQTIVLLFLPLLFFLRFNKWGIAMLFLAFFVGMVLQAQLGDYVYLFEGDEALENKIESYTESEDFGKGNQSIGYIVLRIFVPLCLAILSLLYMKINCRNDKVLKLEPFIMLGFFFMMIQLNFQVSYRYLDYFRIHFLIFYAEFFVRFALSSIRVSKFVAYFRSLIIFSPFFFMVGLKYYSWSFRYYPYSSIFDRKYYENREQKYSEMDNTRTFRLNEY